ncbi:MAG: hypothetical protein RL134_642 [Actinomycetota bacterium]|jgi:ParB family chromosome partitioning protein
MSELQTVPVTMIAPHGRNIRRDLGDLTELVDSIKGIGLLQPLTVAPDAEHNGFVIIAGHRRYAAAVQSGADAVPCIVRFDLDSQARQLEAMLVENLQRTDLTVMEEADAYQQLELLGVKEAAIAKSTGRSRKTVHERLLLASLPTQRREEYEGGKLSLDGAIKCAKLRQQYADDSEILELIDKANTWSFASGIDWSIQRILDARKEPEENEEPADDDLDLDGKRADWEAKYEAERQQRAALAEARSGMWTRMHDWLSGRVATSDPVVADRLLDWALEETLEEWQADQALPMVGIDPPGEDEDEDDAHQRVYRSACALSRDEKVLLVTLILTGACAPRTYMYDTHAEHMVELGYPLTPEDKVVMKGATDAVA